MKRMEDLMKRMEDLIKRMEYLMKRMEDLMKRMEDLMNRMRAVKKMNMIITLLKTLILNQMFQPQLKADPEKLRRSYKKHTEESFLIQMMKVALVMILMWRTSYQG